MKKLFLLLTALVLLVGSTWAYNIGGNSTPLRANLIQQGTSSTFELRVSARNNYTSSNALIARIISPMTSTTSIAGNHSFDCGASNTYYIVNQFTSSGGAYYVEYSSSAELVYNYQTYYVEVSLAGDIQFTWLSTDADGVPTYRIQMSEIEGCFSGAYAYPFANTDPWDIPVYAFKSDGTTPIRLTDYFLVTGAANNASYGSVSGGGYYAAGATPTITANPNPGYRFVRWTDGNTQQSRTLSSLSADVTYTAEFEVAPRGTITGVASPAAGGTVTVSPSGEQAAGTAVTLTVTPNSGWSFQGWQDGNTNNPRTVYVEGDQTYTATLAQQTHDFEYHFTWEDDVYEAGCGTIANGGTKTSNKWYCLRTQIVKNIVHTGAMGYPAINIDITTSQTANTTNGYKAWVSGRYLPYIGTYTNSTNTVGNNRGYIIKSGTSGSTSCFTKFYDQSGNAYTFQSGSIKYMTASSGSWPFIFVDGTFGGKTVRVTIGNAPSYSITLNNQSATTAGTASVTATYTENSNLTSAITIPTKTGYTFGGYYTSTNGGGSQIIDASGNFIGGVSGYTDALKRWLKSEAVTLYAKWTAKTYTVNLNNQEATTAGTASVTATYNAAMPSATMPTKTGYAFNGYYTSTNGGGTQYYTAAGASARNWNIDTNPSTLYAYWTQKTYTLSATTNPAGLGSVTFSKSAPYHYNDAVTLTTPAATGYTFSGWGGTNSSMMSGNVFTFSADAANNTAYAVTANYTANPYTITLNNQSATTGGTSSQTVDYRTALPDITVPTKTGNAFGGYFTETNGGGTMLIGTDGKWVKNVSGYTDASGNLIYADNFELFAKWTELITFTIAPYSNGTVTVTPNDGSGAFTTGSRDLAVGTMVSFSAVANTNYHITNVNLNIKGSDNSFSASSDYTLKTGDGTVTLTANFLPDTYAITYNAGENGTGTIAAGEKTYNVNFTLSSSTFTREGYTQTGWSTTDGGEKAYDLGETYTGNTALNLYPYWEINTYTVTIAKNEDEWGTISATSVANVPYGTVISNNGATVTINGNTVTAILAAATAQYTYGFDSWTNGTETVTGDMTVTANFTRTVNTYDITWKSEDGASTLDTDEAQPYGTATAYNGATTPTKTVTGYTYTFDGWTTEPNGAGTFYANGETPAVGGAATYYAHFTGGANTHTLSWVANGGTLTGGTAAGTTAYGTALTAPTATREGYTFNGWSPSVPATMPDDNATYTAQWNRIEYTITYGGLNGETNTNPDTYTIESEDINLVAPGTRDGYIFAGWKDESNNTITQIAKGSTGNRTLTATWNVKSSNIELCENCDNDHYNTFKANYNNEKVNVTYKRQFTAERWSTMCLPFSLDLATMIANKMYGCVYEFKYATGNANVGSGVNLYFSNAKSIEAGKCYIVNANAELAEKTSFVFSNVKIDVSKDLGEALNSKEAYDRLSNENGYKTKGDIELVGTLRNGTLIGSSTEGNTYMGLKSNKIYYPNTTYPGSTIWAYRGIFHSSEILDKQSMQKMRIIVDGEDRGELIIDEDGDILAPSDAQSRKFIENGVLYIEREGVIYDAQGKRIK